MKIYVAAKELQAKWEEQSLITPYPARGELDVLTLGMEDEATPYPEDQPWAFDEEEESDDEGHAFDAHDPMDCADPIGGGAAGVGKGSCSSEVNS